MYTQNKYSKYYFNIISKAKSRTLSAETYVERHHIIPKSLGGEDTVDNIVSLTAREHFICHLLLPKMTVGKQRQKMIYAIWKMCHSTKQRKELFKLTSRTYNSIKSSMKHVRTSTDFTPEWREKISNARKGQPSWNKGITHTTEVCAKISASRKAKIGTPGWNVRPACSVEKAEKIKQANQGKKWVHNPNNPNERKQLNQKECQMYIELGWKYGTGPKKPRYDKGMPTGKHWWTDGVLNIQSVICPGPDFKRGRIVK